MHINDPLLTQMLRRDRRARMERWTVREIKRKRARRPRPGAPPGGGPST